MNKPTKKNESRADVLRAAGKRNDAFTLRMEGHTYRGISSALGCDVATAYRYVQQSIQETAAQYSESRAELVALEAARLDELQSSIWTAAMNGDLKAGDTCLKIMAQRARLLGLDSPVKVAPTNPAGDEAYQPVSVAECIEMAVKVLENNGYAVKKLDE